MVELVEPSLDRLDDDLGARPRARPERLLEPHLTEEAFGAARVDDSVGVQDQRVAGPQANRAIDRRELWERSEHAAPSRDALDVAPCTQDQRKRMAGAGDDQPGAVTVRPETY